MNNFCNKRKIAMKIIQRLSRKKETFSQEENETKNQKKKTGNSKLL